MKALWTTALLLLLTLRPAGAQVGPDSQTDWIGDFRAMSGELTARGLAGNELVAYPIEWVTGEGAVGARISVRYRMWILAGEPVWTFEPKYELETIKLGPHSIRLDATLPPETAQGDLQPNGTTSIRASRDLFELIRITDLRFSARLTQSDAGQASVYRNGWMSAVFARPGQWGWDVPGSPSWGAALTHQGEPLGDGEEISAWLDAASAKELWKRLDAAWTLDRTEPLEYLRCYGLRLGLSSFLARIERVSPGITRPLYRRMLRGETSAEAEERTELEYQLQTLLHGLRRELDRQAGPVLAAGASEDLTRRLELTEEAFLLLPDPPAYLTEQLEQAQLQVAGASLEDSIARVMPELRAGLPSDPEEPLPEAVQIQLEALAKQHDEVAVPLSAALLRRLEALKSLTTGSGWRVVAEWQSPRRPSGFESRSSPGKVELKEFATGEGGRAVALFEWRTEGDSFWFTRGWAVDAHTGEVLRTEPRSGAEQSGYNDLSRYQLWGPARYLVSIQEPGTGGNYNNYGSVRQIFDLGSQSPLPREPGGWTGVLTSWNNHEEALIARFDGSGHLVCWDTTSGSVRWSVDVSAKRWPEKSYETRTVGDELVLSLYDWKVGVVLELETGAVLLDTRDSATRARFPESVTMEDLEAEALRLRPPTEPRATWSHSSLPPEYQPAFEQWPRSGQINDTFDTIVCVKPGDPDTGEGGVTYQLLVR